MNRHLSDSEQIVQAGLDFYNRRDIDNFMACFRDDIKVFNFSDNKVTIDGIDQCRKFYQELFNASPDLHATIVKRIIFDNKVIDHERIIGRQGSKDVLEVVVINEVMHHKIFRLTVIKK